MTYHQPVLLDQCIKGLQISGDGVYVDATFGGGGHAKSILLNLNAKGHLYGFDQDEDAEKNAPSQENFTFIRSNFRFLKQYMKYYKVSGVDGILVDLGVSSHQFDTPERGFSFRYDALLDMRMNVHIEKDARHVLNNYSQDQLQSMLSEYGEVRNARTLASVIVEKRKTKAFETIAELNEVLDRMWKGNRNKYFAQVYQAIRIEVNDEMGALIEFLYAAKDLLKSGGRLVIISYHSIEDRIVKNFLKSGNIEGRQVKDEYGNIERPFQLINKKPIVPNESELLENSRSRSAKLRIAQKK